MAKSPLPQGHSLEKWRKRNLYYYHYLERFYVTLVQPQKDVLEIGSGLGYLLKAVNPATGLGVEIDAAQAAYARQRFPELDFRADDGETCDFSRKFDYILLENTVNYLDNIEKLFNNLESACKPSTRLILTFHNPLWNGVLKLATKIRQRRPVPSLNWLSLPDVENLLYLVGFEVIKKGKTLLFPKSLPGLSRLINRFLAPLPLLNKLCLIHYVIARKRLREATPQRHPQPRTCSVIVPARNEAENIEACVQRMPRLGSATEIIFVEGHSTDGTWEEIQRVAAVYGKAYDIKICQQSGVGKGDAVRQGFDMASGDILMILDADLTVRPEDLVYFYEAVTSGVCEFANGCRLIYPVSPKAMPWLNKMANRFFAAVISYLLNTKIKDSLCGTKALSRENYRKIAANRAYFGDFDPFGDFDLLFGAAKLNLKMNDIPVRYLPRSYGSSNIHHFKEGLVLLRMCWHAARKLKFV